MCNQVLTETMKIWLKDIYLSNAKEFRGGASNLHLMALGSDNKEATQLEGYADEQREFASILENLAEELDLD